MKPAASKAQLRLVGLEALVYVTLSCVFATHANAAMVAAWGDNSYGQCRLPQPVTNAIAISAGTYHSLALLANGTVIAWGTNQYGQISVPHDLSNVTAIAAGGTHSLALKADGTVVAWGNQGPTNVAPGLSNIVAIAAGANFGAALAEDGRVVCWGTSYLSPTNVPATATKLVKIFGGPSCIFGVRRDGSVLAWGYHLYGALYVPVEVINPVKIACGTYHAAALLNDGSVIAWGYISPNGITNVPVPAPACGVTDIAIFGLTNLMVGRDGRLYAWSGWDTNPPTEPQVLYPCLSNVTAVAASGHALALVDWGPPVVETAPEAVFAEPGCDAQLGIIVTGCYPLAFQWFRDGIKLTNTAHITGTTTSNLLISSVGPADVGRYVLQVSNAFGVVQSGPVHLLLTNCPPMFLVLPKGGTGLLGNSFTFTSSIVGPEPIRLQWKFNGVDIYGATNPILHIPVVNYANTGYYSLHAWNPFGYTNSPKIRLDVAQVVYLGYSVGTNWLYQLGPVSADTGELIEISPNMLHCLGLRADRTVTVWTNTLMRVRWPPTGPLPFLPPTNPPPAHSNIVRIAAGLQFNVAVDSSGRVYSWGQPRLDLTTMSNLYPTNIHPRATNIIDVKAGYNFVLALRDDGYLVRWNPYNRDYTGYMPGGIPNVIAISMDNDDISAALTADGTLAIWSASGLIARLSGFTNAIDVRVSNPICLLLLNNGRPYAIPLNTNADVNAVCAAINQSSLLTNAISAQVIYVPLLSLPDPTQSTLMMLLRADGTATIAGLLRKTNFSVTQLPFTNLVATEITDYSYIALTGDGKPHFKIHPRNLTLGAGAKAEFHARAVGQGPLAYQWYFNGKPIVGQTNPDLTLPVVSGKNAGTYFAVAQNAYGTATSSVAVLTVVTACGGDLGGAVNAQVLSWQSSSNAPWFAQNIEAYDLNCAAQSGPVSHNQSSAIWTVAEGPATISFWWKVSSEEWFDVLKFELDNVVQATISGEVDWQLRSYRLGSGLHTLRWMYTKDDSVSAGADASWLDQVIYQPDPPVVSVTPGFIRARAGSIAVFQSQVVGAGPLTYQWFHGTVPRPGATTSTLLLTNLSPADAGQYWLSVTNLGGLGTSAPVSLVVVGKAIFRDFTLTDSGNFTAFATDETGLGYVPDDLTGLALQVSTNLTDWYTLPVELTLTNGAIMFTDTTSSSYPVRFYRLIQH